MFIALKENAPRGGGKTMVAPRSIVSWTKSRSRKGGGGVLAAAWRESEREKRREKKDGGVT